MTKTLLFYEQAAPVSSSRHLDWSIEIGANYAFSRFTNAVPLTAVEFARAGVEYPVVFTGPETQVAPLALLGLEDRQNLHIDDKGRWPAGYIPAFVRRYPFVFATDDGGENFTVCVDEEFAGCNQDGRGERLFNDAGEHTEFFTKAVEFLSEYQRQYIVTDNFSKRLVELDLLEPVQANVQTNAGRNVSLTGFRVVSRERLKDLDADALKSLMDADYMELIYTHLTSLSAFGRMVDRLAAQTAPTKARASGRKALA